MRQKPYKISVGSVLFYAPELGGTGDCGVVFDITGPLPVGDEGYYWDDNLYHPSDLYTEHMKVTFHDGIFEFFPIDRRRCYEKSYLLLTKNGILKPEEISYYTFA